MRSAGAQATSTAIGWGGGGCRGLYWDALACPADRDALIRPAARGALTWPADRGALTWPADRGALIRPADRAGMKGAGLLGEPRNRKDRNERSE